jgi:putative radical SAM enzyme (TIGR03279 family)
VAADGHALADIIDWRWLSDGDSVALDVLDATGVSRQLSLRRELGRSWGIEFSSAIFDAVRTCRNDCAFCFMRQLPKGLRRSLYLRDDDFRLSFLQGNFVTLTNLSDADVERIVEQRLSPLYVSLHSSNPEVRAQLVCARDADRGLERFDELLEGGIDLHVQVVLVPGVNDGAELDRTLSWIAQREGIASVGVVPLGYTRFQERFASSYTEAGAATAVIDQVTEWQQAFLERDGSRLVFLADEFYLNAGRAVPPFADYEGAPQFENGIGMAAAFAEEAAEILREGIGLEPRTCITGTLFAPVLRALLAASSADGVVRVLGVENAFFGGNVSVTGLLTGADICTAVNADGFEGIYLVPDVIFNADGVTLDDMTFAQMRDRSESDLRLVSSDPAGLRLDTL